MKNTYLALAVLCFFFSCKSKHAQNASDTVTTSSATNTTKVSVTPNVLAEKFRPFIRGTWVKSNYIDAILKTRSPYASSWGLGGVADILISAEGPLKDSLVVGYSLNNHEGGNFTIFFKQGHLPTSLKINLPDYDNRSNSYELGYKVEGADTTLVLYRLNKNNAVISRIKYTRVSRSASSDNAASGIDYITNDKLMAGTYTTIDQTGSKLRVQFTSEGKVYRFEDHKDYYVNSDFNAGPANNIDQIIFDLYDDAHRKDYTFEIRADTLNLFAIKYNADSTIQSRGKLMYKLVRDR